MWVHIAPRNGAIVRGKYMPGHYAVSCIKIAELIKMPFGLWTLVGPMKHVLYGVHIGAVWHVRIRLNRPCSAAYNYVVPEETRDSL